MRNDIKKVTVNNKTKVEKILLKIGINPESVIVFKNGKLITEDDYVENGDEIEVLPVSSSG
ncbi:MAG: MoaD/ThiS family protein [Thermoprotei archaeon]|nr:MoaD/ThiS family protein [Thermoprotei archaeon]